MTDEQQTAVGKYAAKHGNTATVRHFSDNFEKPMNESTVRGLKEKYLAELHHKRKTVDVGDEGADLCVTSLQPKKRGRKLLLGEKLDSQVQVYIKYLHERGAIVNTAVVLGAAKGIVEKTD